MKEFVAKIENWRRERTLSNESGHVGGFSREELCYPGEKGVHGKYPVELEEGEPVEPFVERRQTGRYKVTSERMADARKLLNLYPEGESTEIVLFPQAAKENPIYHNATLGEEGDEIPLEEQADLRDQIQTEHNN